jgi:ABC-2 type transport system permease protein
MNTPSNTAGETFPNSDGTASVPNISPVQPFYWSVRRELWENKSIYIAPLIVAGVLLFGFLVSTIGLPERRRAVLQLDPGVQRAAIEMPYDVVAMMLLFTGFIVAVFYCLDALYGERRERSILFWKSLPVSDLTTVLSKASIALLVLPPLIFAIVIATQLVMLLWTSVLLIVNGLNPATTWTHFNMIRQSLILLYGLIVAAIWHAPIYGWLLLVSGWVRRATFLWAILPPFAISVFEKITFGTSHIASLVVYRLMGFASEAFAFNPHGKESIHDLAQLTPGRYLSAPGLWIGLVCAVTLFVAAARLRRYRGPI